MPWPARFLAVLLIAGAGLALGIGLLAPEVRAVVTQGGKAGGEGSLVQLEELSQRTTVYARDGSVQAVLHAEENRQPVALDQVPPLLYNAILDVEDDRFWVHRGVDLRSTVRALKTNVNAGGVRQGGSTITQQLVKNALLTPERSLNRKVREAVLAVRLENKLSKKEILERYLNTVYFGNGAYGVQAAAETYFNTDVSNLDEAQAALLAGIIRNPDGYDPLRHPDAARARRNVAFDRMVANGHLTRDQADELRDAPLPDKASRPVTETDDYFTEEVKQRLLDDKRLGETPQERYNALFKGGLKIYTTLDPRMQNAADTAVRTILPNTKGKFTASLVTVEPGTGAVRAMVAGSDFANAHYNLATARGGSGRQPGSSFKPIVLLTALENHYSPNDTIDGNTPCHLKIPGFAPYDVENFEGEGGGTLSLTDATVHSVNCAYVRLGATVGLDKVVDMAGRLGINKDRLHPYPSISLGAQEVSPLEMAAAYAAIDNDGVYHAPRFVEKVVDRRGKVVFEGPDKGKVVTDKQYTREEIQVLRQVVQRGTGTRARIAGRDVAGKTGTSQNFENAWFVGFTPQLATAVWMGSPAGNVSMRNVGGIRVAGGTYPARIWNAYMTKALDGMPALSFPLPNAKQIPKGKFINDKFSAHKKPAARPAPVPAPGVPGPGGTDSTAVPPSTPPPTDPTPTTKPPGGGPGGGKP
jgi:1A family penicillin-binding protein